MIEPAEHKEPSPESVLGLHGITKRFAEVTALEDVSFNVKRGSIHALLGENGAGKTTLMRIAFGLVAPDTGRITIDGRNARISSPADAISSGIGMVHQQFSLVPAMTVAENVALGGSGRYKARDVARHIEEIGTRTGLKLNPADRVANLGSADRQKLEIIRTLAHDARVIILDEPTAVLTPADVGELFSQIRAFAARGGSVVLITHKLRDALEHADEVTVLRRGRVVLRSTITDTSESLLATAMLGSTLVREMEKRSTVNTSAPVVRMQNVILPEKHGALNRPPVDLEVKAGEIVGVAALEGAAASLLRVLAGRLKATRGKVDIPEQVGFVPEDRRGDALIDDFSLTENVALGVAGKKRGLLNWRDLATETAEIVKTFDVRAGAITTTPEKLSGGNQQRFVLGRELHKNPPLLVLENPTQGLDVSAAAFIHDRMRLAQSRGIAIVFYSSDLDELAELSDRVIIVSGSGILESPPDKSEIGKILISGRSQTVTSA